MSLRWRSTGQLFCGAKSQQMDGDCYIDDRLHYELSVIQKVVIPCVDEETTGRWEWLHGECCTTKHPDDVRPGVYPFCEKPQRVDLP